jgi:antitoxin ParD1/3/4
MILRCDLVSPSARMNVSLTPELEQLVHLKVQTGRYTSASEVVREALRLMEERDQVQALHKDEIRKKIAAGVASLRTGKSVDGDAFMAAMDAELAELERRGSV